MPKLKSNPTTIVISAIDDEANEQQEIRWIGREPTYGEDEFRPGEFVVVLPIRRDEKRLSISSFETMGPDALKGTTAESGFNFVVRPTMEYDVVGSMSVQSRIPLPLEVIAMLVSEDGANEPVDLQALANDDGFVSTLLLNSSAGVFLRYSKTWVTLKNPDLIEDLDIYDVEEEAVDLYDQYDQVGRSIHVASLPLLEADDELRANEKVSVVATARDLRNQVENNMVAAAAATSPITSAREVIASIPAAVDDPSLRWYVERRAKALGVDESELPWKSGQ